MIRLKATGINRNLISQLCTQIFFITSYLRCCVNELIFLKANNGDFITANKYEQNGHHGTKNL